MKQADLITTEPNSGPLGAATVTRRLKPVLKRATRGLKRLVDNRVAAMLAERERRVSVSSRRAVDGDRGDRR